MISNIGRNLSNIGRLPSVQNKMKQSYPKLCLDLNLHKILCVWETKRYQGTVNTMVGPRDTREENIQTLKTR